MVRAVDAWARSRGDGVVIGHLDTGFTDAPELAGALDAPARHGFDFVDGDWIPRDDLQRRGLLDFPGHGTGTASVIASRETGMITGAAPGALLRPYRVSRSVVQISQANMATAIWWAADRGCDVLSISMGGLWSAALERAVAHAERQGVLVIAAAGNYVRFVVWPARYPTVVACAACGPDERPWRHSSRGRTADITAPGHQVWRAVAGGAPAPGSGTSFATATVAGIAALWLGAHGRANLEARYGRANLGTVFRQVLRATARTLPSLSGGRWGAGLVDADALVRSPLPAHVTLEQLDEPARTGAAERYLPIAWEAAGAHDVDERHTIHTLLPTNTWPHVGDELAFHLATAEVHGEESPARSARENLLRSLASRDLSDQLR